eukprot:2897399-Rhodomonas_salina.10
MCGTEKACGTTQQPTRCAVLRASVWRCTRHVSERVEGADGRRKLRDDRDDRRRVCDDRCCAVPIALRTCYAVSGADYAAATRCPVLTYRMVRTGASGATNGSTLKVSSRAAPVGVRGGGVNGGLEAGVMGLWRLMCREFGS